MSAAPRLLSATTAAAAVVPTVNRCLTTTHTAGCYCCSTTNTTATTRTFFSTPALLLRKPGVSEPADIRAFVQQQDQQQQDQVVVIVDVRESFEATENGPLPTAHNGGSLRPNAIHLPWDRTTGTMPLPSSLSSSSNVSLDTPIITHCGGGGRGQKACDFLKQHGYTNVINGGGPEDAECWKEFGEL